MTSGHERLQVLAPAFVPARFAAAPRETEFAGVDAVHDLEEFLFAFLTAEDPVSEVISLDEFPALIRYVPGACAKQLSEVFELQLHQSVPRRGVSRPGDPSSPAFRVRHPERPVQNRKPAASIASATQLSVIISPERMASDNSSSVIWSTWISSRSPGSGSATLRAPVASNK